ncbi:MAG: carboxypeptidase-like regulatory domain-containing protein [Deltaproteobacteria bacterium]|nr:carboxypeptidase-like regulatory domain-containing protein [Deltaproteobacteria bacterium]
MSGARRPITARVAIAAMLLAGCGAGSAGDSPDASIITGDAGIFDAPPSCAINVTFSLPPGHAEPIAGDIIQATGLVTNGPAFLQPVWQVKHNGVTTTPPAIDDHGLVVQFTVDEAGVYEVVFAPDNLGACSAWDMPLNVKAAGANSAPWRLRVVPSTGAAPPQEQIIRVSGGAPAALGTIVLQPGSAADGHLLDGSAAPVAAALRFEPDATPDLPVEASAGNDGAFHVRVQNGPHHVLVVPIDATRAPARLPWNALTPDLTLPSSDLISGTVRAPDDSPVAGARVVLTIAGVPTTVATTDASGAWSVRGHRGGTVAVTVAPPAASGLPRLEVTGAALDLAQPVAIHYAPGLATTDLGGAVVRAGAVAAPGARVSFVGPVAAAATITAGTTVTAGGRIQLSAVANGAGVLPPTRVPAIAQRAVIATTPTVFAVVALDPTSAPATIDAPGLVSLTGTITDASGAPRANARVLVTPTGDLGAATMIPAAAITDASGGFAIQVAPGGHYALAATDPALALARVDRPDVTGGALGAVALGPALPLSATIQVAAQPGGLVGAAVSLLCATCTGVDRTKPVAEGVTDIAGGFSMAVPDPGVAPMLR